MSSALPIPIIGSPAKAVSASYSPSTSTLHDRFRASSTAASTAIRLPKVLHPVENEDLRLLLPENISQEAVRTFRSQGFQVDHSTKAMTEDELLQKIPSYHAIGIRSKTKITEKVIKAASKVSKRSLSSHPPSHENVDPYGLTSIVIISCWLSDVFASVQTRWTS